VNVLGFSFDWGNDDGGIGGISQGDCRYVPHERAVSRRPRPNNPVIIWLNLNSKQEVDELFERWKDTGAKIVEAVEDKPWNLREFRVADLDGNQLRVFYDFNWEMSEERRLERHRRASREAAEVILAEAEPSTDHLTQARLAVEVC
jgi:hypothetical protein